MAAFKQIKKMPEPFSDAWQAEANRLARGFAPLIYPCRRCNGPCAQGYCCGNCGSTDPANPNVAEHGTNHHGAY